MLRVLHLAFFARASASCVVTQLAGGVEVGASDGAGTAASFRTPTAVARSSFNGLLYVTDIATTTCGR